MKNIILNQRAERDELMARPYQQRDTIYNFKELSNGNNGEEH